MAFLPSAQMCEVFQAQESFDRRVYSRIYRLLYDYFMIIL
jgi:hypothetical protein